MRAVYADPPYIGQALKRYSDDPKCSEVDHKDLIKRLETYDCWALSLSSTTLKTILPMCPEECRIGSWCKPFSSFKPNVNPAYTWEPVIFRLSRNHENKRTREQRTVKDHVLCSITLQTGMCGAKPEFFCYWVFDMLNLKPTDTLYDMFPGSGNVTTFWEKFCAIRMLNPNIDVGAYVDDLLEQQIDLLPK